MTSPKLASSTPYAAVEILPSREVPLGGPRAMPVRRTLPLRQRALIGAWCFVDHYGPDDVAATGGMDVAPHPHTGLQTVSWLFQGEVTHHDSVGNAAQVRPGELNVMTAGPGISHTEVSTPETKVLHGVQLWLALPDVTRHTATPGLTHYAPPVTQVSGGSLLVFLGSLAGAESPVETHTPLLGAEVRIDAGAEIALEVSPEFEHGLLVDTGAVELEGTTVERGAVGYVGIGKRVLRVRNAGDEPARALLIGGTPFGEEILMWWNFVARRDEEIRQFRQQWQERGARFGFVEGYVGHGGPGKNAEGMEWLPAPELPPVALKPRHNAPPHARTD